MAKSARGRRGDGSIYRDGDYWIAALSVGSGKNRRRLKAKAASEAAAREQLRRLRAEAGAVVALDEPGVTLEAYVTNWHENAVQPRVRKKTIDLYTSVLRTHVYPHIGHLRLDRVREQHLFDLFARLERADVGDRLREIAYLRLAATFKAATGRAIAKNPMLDVPKPRTRRRSMSIWNAEQARAFLAATADDDLAPLYRLVLSVGLRRGEALALRVADFDARARRLRIEHTLTDSGELAEPKTAGARRAIDLPDRVVAALLAHRADLLAKGLGGSPWLFPVEATGDARRGEPRLSRAVSAAFGRAVARVEGLPKIRFHDLRHTCATLRLANGDHPKVVSEMLGHASIQITLDTYSHVLPSMQREAADRFDAVL